MHATTRFSNRVQDYRKHRPGYPPDIITILKKEGALPSHAVVADIGSGTGLLTQLFFNHVHRIYAVEPNENMRRQAELDFSSVPQFSSRAGSAESTTLSPAGFDLVTAGQAFHWFDAEKTKKECRRILKPGGFIALVWNIRDTEADDFQRDYEHILRTHIRDYKQTFSQTTSDEHVYNFFDSADVPVFQFANEQSFDVAALKGRLMSSSYAPKPPDPDAAILMHEVERLFDQHRQNGVVKFIYKTKMYLGQLH